MKRSTLFAVIAVLVMSLFSMSVCAASDTGSAEEIFDAQIISAELTPEEKAALGEITDELTDGIITDGATEDVTEAEDASSDFAGITVTPMNFVNNLSFMGLGMLGIFVVIALIMIITTVLNKSLSGKKADEE